MSGDPLQALLKLREQQVEAARLDYAACLQAETAAEHAAHEADAAIANEAASAADIAADDAAVEAFAAWLPEGRRRARAAQAKRDTTELETARARAALAVSRAGMKAVEKLIDTRAAEREADLARRAQAELDEIGARLSSGTASG